MATFFPHLYEYSQVINTLKNEDKNNTNTSNKNKPTSTDITKTSQTNLPLIPITSKTQTFTQYYQSKDIKFLTYLEEKVQKLRESNYNPINFYNVKIDEILKENSELSNVEKYQKPKEWPFENQMKFPESGKHWMVCDVILCIEFAKVLPFFEKLIVNDQFEILKSITLFNTLLTSAYYSSATNSNVLIYPDGHMPIKYPIMHNTHYDLYERIVEPVKRINLTKEEFVLLKIIILSSTKSRKISTEGRDILETAQNHYTNLLLKYLQAKHGQCPGAVRFSQIISVIEAIIHFAQKSREFYIWYRTSNWLGIPPLLMDEIIY